MKKLLCLVRQNAKGIAAALGAGAVYIAAHVGTSLPEGFEGTLAALVAGIIVWAVPNTDCP